jgi:hypothetical protein
MTLEDMDPRQLMELLPYLSPEDRKELDRLLTADQPIWMAQPGPQLRALESDADILYYGGQAGGGKTDLLLGLALTEQEHSILFRREGVQLTGIIERITKMLPDGRKGFSQNSGQGGIWRLPQGRILELGSVKEPGDWMKYQGRPHDAKLFDEIPHFTELQFRSLIGWMRTDNPKVRQRVVCAGNPPTDPEGEWVIRFWAPWLDENHPNPAKDGELRWFVTDEDGQDMEVSGPAMVKLKGRMVKPKSRTFIRSSVDDNLFLATTGYADTLMALPEPLRSMMAEGNFNAGRTDDVWQLVPTHWVEAAQRRWQARDTNKGTMDRLGFDIARGGIDRSVAARRHGQWFDELVTTPGAFTNDGPKAAAFIVALIRDGAAICADGVGIGTAAVDFMRGMNLNVESIIGSEGSKSMDKTGKLRFKNRRAEMYWRLREALDPAGDDPIALPPDPELKTEILAHRYKVVQMGQAEAGIQVRSKDEVMEAIGRSPDKSDAVAMTFVDHVQTVAVEQARAWRSMRGR